MTGPKVLRGRETSMLWLGVSGVWMARGAGDGTKAILVKLNCRVYHVLQSFAAEVHFHIDVPLGVSKCS